MKISLLLKREPFAKIFEDTFSSFLSEMYNQQYVVEWFPRKHINQFDSFDQKWYCNSLINSIFIKGTNPEVFNSINAEYSYNPHKPWISPLQQVFLYFSKNKFFATAFSNYIIKISPPIEDAENKLIIGGNTKIRLIDYASKKVYVVLKKGFKKEFINREIFIRNNYKYYFVPKLIEKSNKEEWYSEQYISGVSPDRIGGHKGHDVLWDAVQHVHKMLNTTKKSESLSRYVGSLQKRIVESVEQISHIDETVKKDITDLASILGRHLNTYSDCVVTTAYCHGDFQEGNIIYDGVNTWILDWEYSGFKQVGYDLFVLLLKSRVSKNFSNRFLRLMNNELDHHQILLINSWPEIQWDTKFFKKRSLFLFLLEELDFHIEENGNVSFFRESFGLKSFIREAMKIKENSNLFIDANII